MGSPLLRVLGGDADANKLTTLSQESTTGGPQQSMKLCLLAQTWNLNSYIYLDVCRGLCTVFSVVVPHSFRFQERVYSGTGAYSVLEDLSRLSPVLPCECTLLQNCMSLTGSCCDGLTSL